MPMTSSDGRSPVEYLRTLKTALEVTEGDMIFALGRQTERIQQRTVDGVDYNGQAFAPYSTNGPYHHDPSRESRFSGYTSLVQRRGVALHHARFYGGTRKRGGVTVKYESYAAFKAARGVGNVDLGGMEGSLLPALRISVNGAEHDLDEALGIGLDTFPDPVIQGAVGIYDDPMAQIAQGHNDGIPGRLPQRTFIGISDDDLNLVSADLSTRMQERLEKMDAD